MKALMTLPTLFLTACATAPNIPSTWENIVYQGLDRELKLIEPAKVVDCGYYNLSAVQSKQRNRTIKGQMRCAQDAQSNNRPYKMGYTWIPADSYMSQIIMSQANGVLIKKIDMMLDNTDSNLNSQLCGRVIFDFSNLTVQPQNCRPI